MSDNPYLKPPLPVQIGPYAATLRIHRDERGIAWIDDSNIKVIEVVLDYVQGWPPEKIHEQHPHLSLAQIYSAIAYYHDYKQEVDDLIRAWDEDIEYERERSLADRKAWRDELRARWARRIAQQETS